MKCILRLVELMLVIVLLASFASSNKIRSRINIIRTTSDFATLIGNGLMADTKVTLECLPGSWRTANQVASNVDFKNALSSLQTMYNELKGYKSFFNKKVNYECHYAGSKKGELIKELLPQKKQAPKIENSGKQRGPHRSRSPGRRKSNRKGKHRRGVSPKARRPHRRGGNKRHRPHRRHAPHKRNRPHRRHAPHRRNRPHRRHTPHRRNRPHRRFRRYRPYKGRHLHRRHRPRGGRRPHRGGRRPHRGGRRRPHRGGRRPHRGGRRRPHRGGRRRPHLGGRRRPHRGGRRPHKGGRRHHKGGRKLHRGGRRPHRTAQPSKASKAAADGNILAFFKLNYQRFFDNVINFFNSSLFRSIQRMLSCLNSKPTGASFKKYFTGITRGTQLINLGVRGKIIKSVDLLCNWAELNQIYSHLERAFTSPSGTKWNSLSFAISGLLRIISR